MSMVRVAVVQDSPVVFDAMATVAKVADLTKQAADKGARLVLFPEAFISGYPKGWDFGARVGMRFPEGREDFRKYYEGSIEVPGPATEALGRAAKEAGVYLTIGVMEREGGTLYCTALFFGPDGSMLGKHRKLMPTAMERLVWGFGDGSTMPVIDTEVGKIGSVICWENYMPMLRMYMYSQGVQLYLAPTADDRETNLPTMRFIALEGRCFVLSSCQYVHLGDYPECSTPMPEDDPATVMMRGGSCIIDPLGQVLAGPEFDGPCILTADLDLDQIVRGKFDLDTPGHYARPDVFQLHVNLKPQPAVTAWDGETKNPFEDGEA
ncbi:MAG: carbon-nitrogen hydrolase family protein [Desulfarculaceae bacterium]|nr:carbon-nitrogen hydrolase family protein [Desulfarculaceae bacterium]